MDYLTKLGFTELRAACVRCGGRLTKNFSNARNQDRQFRVKNGADEGDGRRVGKHAGLEDELADIEAAHLQERRPRK